MSQAYLTLQLESERQRRITLNTVKEVRGSGGGWGQWAFGAQLK